MFGMSNANSEAYFFSKQRRFYVENVSSQDVPPLGVMEVQSITDSLDGKSVYNTQKMTPLGAGKPELWIFNTFGTIPSSTNTISSGIGTFDFPTQALMLVSDAVQVGMSVGPIADEWYLSPDGTGLTVIDVDTINSTLIIDVGELGDSKIVRPVWVSKSSSASAGVIEYTIESLTTTSDPDYIGLRKATVRVRVGPSNLVGTTVEVFDHSGCIFDIPSMVDYTGFAFWGRSRTLDTAKPCEELTPFHWAAINRCCGPNTGTYRECP